MDIDQGAFHGVSAADGLDEVAIVEEDGVSFLRSLGRQRNIRWGGKRNARHMTGVGSGVRKGGGDGSGDTMTILGAGVGGCSAGGGGAGACSACAAPPCVVTTGSGRFHQIKQRADDQERSNHTSQAAQELLADPAVHFDCSLGLLAKSVIA